MTPAELEEIAQRTAGLIIEGGSVEVQATDAALDEMLTASVAATTCTCQHPVDGEPGVGTVAAVAALTADAVARSDAPASLAPEDGMAPASTWEVQYLEQQSRIGALEDRLAALEADISRILVESTNLQTIN